jgi:hypothetical protein
VLAPDSPWREAVTARAGLPVEVEATAGAAKHAMVPVEPNRIHNKINVQRVPATDSG